MKKHLMYPLLMFALLWGLAGCAPPTEPAPPSTRAAQTPADASPMPITPTPRDEPTPTPRPTPTPTPVPVSLVLWEGLPPGQTSALAQDIAAFQRTHPGLEVDMQHYDEPAELARAVSEKRVDMDVALGPASLLYGLVGADAILPPDTLFEPADLDRFAAPTLDGCTLEGRVWGLPDTSGGHLLLLYNEKLVESPPTNTVEMVELARSIRARGYAGLVMNSYEPLWLLPWLVAYDGYPLDADGFALDTPEMVKALELYAAWHDANDADGGIVPVLTYDRARESFTAGRAGMLIDGAWAIEEMPPEDELDWGVTLLPELAETGKRPSPLVSGRYWMVGSETAEENLPLLREFLEYVTGEERQVDWARRFGQLPTRRAALNSPSLFSWPALRISAQQMQAGFSLPPDVDTNALLDAMRPPLTDLLEGRADPEEAAAAMQHLADNPE